jgi:hypothetical protein
VAKIDEIHETVAVMAVRQEHDSKLLGQVHNAVYGTDGRRGLKERMAVAEQAIRRRSAIVVAIILAAGTAAGGAWAAF